MRPIRGVVVSVRRSTLVIKLESGLTINMPRIEGFDIGDKCNVSYDFTENKPAKLFRHRQRGEEEDHTKEVIVENVETGEDSDIIEVTCDEIEILPPEDEWEFWNPDSGILELS